MQWFPAMAEAENHSIDIESGAPFMKCEGFAQITDLADYLDNNRLIAHYGGFNIMESLPSYWTYDRFLRQVDNSALKPIMAKLVRKLYELGVVDAPSLPTRWSAPRSSGTSRTITGRRSWRGCWKRPRIIRTPC